MASLTVTLITHASAQRRTPPIADTTFSTAGENWVGAALDLPPAAGGARIVPGELGADN